MAPAVTTVVTVNPAGWATGVVASAPRTTVQAAPDTLMTAMISLVRLAVVSTMWNWVGGVPLEFAAGNVADEATVQVSTVPLAGAVVPPAMTVVDGWLAKISTAANAHPDHPWSSEEDRRYGPAVLHRRNGRPVRRTSVPTGFSTFVVMTELVATAAARTRL